MPSIASRAGSSGSCPDADAAVSPAMVAPWPARTASPEVWESLFVSCLKTIDSIVLAFARRHRLSADDADDLASLVRLRIMTDDFAILRKFQQRSSLRTYLTVVIQRIFLDERIARLGKWRPSQRALREGPAAVVFERLTTRDGFTFDEACATLEVDHRLAIPRAALESLYARHRRASTRRFCPTDQLLDEMPAMSEAPDESLARRERVTLAKRARASLARALSALEAQDRHILKLRFVCGFSVADVAKATGLKQKGLYVRCNRLLRLLRRRLENEGIVGDQIMEVIGLSDTSVGEPV
jgi:RNA polymerase sigma factor (sigma-70 family)